MNDLLVRTDRGEVGATFRLSPFITDWEAGRLAFISCIADDFGDLLNPRPHDFSSAVPADLGEAWCKYRVFGGASTAILRPEALQLTFPNAIETDYPIIFEMLRRMLKVLLPRIGGYDRQSYTVIDNHHAAIVEGESEAYLSEFANRKMSDAMRHEVGVECRPSVGFTLRSTDGNRVLRRSIEQSEILSNGLFITNHIFVSLPELTEFDDERSWIGQINKLANRASGIVYQEEERNDDSGT
ncbi:MAG: hypothetical protein OXC08_05170 [Thiotrichales bacterium]|nr:hypothetical protein [Thiotrichales bacterium]